MAEGVRFEISVDDNGTPKVKRFTDSMKGAEKGAHGMGKGLDIASSAVGKLGALIAVGAVVNFAKNTLNAMDAAKQFGQSVGISTASVVGFGYAAEMSGSSAEDMQGSMTKLANKLADGSIDEKLKSIGVAALDAQGNVRGVDEVMLDLAGAFEKMKDSPEKTALAIDMFGKSGSKLIPALNQGTESMRAMIDEGVNLQGASEKNADTMDAFNDSLAKVKAGGSGLIMSIISSWAPELKNFGKLVDDIAKNMAENALASRQKEAQDEQMAYADARLRFVSYNEDKARLQKAYEDKNITKYVYEKNLASLNYYHQKDNEAIKAYNDKKQAGAIEASKKENDLQATRTTERVNAENEKNEKLLKQNKEYLEKKAKQEQDADKAQWSQIDAELAQNAINEEIKLANKKKVSDENAERERMERKLTAENYTADANEASEFSKRKMDLQKAESENEAYWLNVEKEEQLASRQNKIDSLNAVAGIASNISQMMSNIDQLEINKINEKYDNEVARAAGNKDKIAKIEAEREKAVQKVRKQSFEAQKHLASVQILSLGTVATMQAHASAPPPFNIPLAALVAGLTATQLALNESQKLVLGGSPVGSHAQVTMNEQGTEWVTNAQATRTLGQEFLQSANSGASINELASKLTGGQKQGNVVINVSGFIDSQNSADMIAKAVRKEMRGHR